MSPLIKILLAWSWQPSVIAGCVALMAGYGYAIRRWCVSKSSERYWSYGPASLYVLGVLVLFLALESPIDVLGDDYLFSMHMVQHLFLTLVVPPLLLLGIPAVLFDRLLAWAPARRMEAIVGHPSLAWTIGTVTLWAWHLPALYNAALANETIHAVEHLCFLVSATMFWWPIVAPVAYRLSVGWSVVYLALGAAANSALGIILTFAPLGLYPAYLQPDDPLGILPWLRTTVGFTAREDQQLGGVLMWIVGGWAYLAGVIGIIARWYAAEDREEEAALEPVVTETGRIQI